MTSFNEVVTMKQSLGNSNQDYIIKNLDVLIAMLEKVKLNKANQVELM
jgi:hypothetical protein